MYAFERPALFGETPFEAIASAPSQPTREQVLAAARDSRAAAFLARLPGGMQTPLDETPMSGGEVQRLGLARAFAHAGQARLLILDDATSSLDTVTEMLVSRALTDQMGGRTRLIVAHRATTAARADLVAWLDRGRLRALAPHHELWADPRVPRDLRSRGRTWPMLTRSLLIRSLRRRPRDVAWLAAWSAVQSLPAPRLRLGRSPRRPSQFLAGRTAGRARAGSGCWRWPRWPARSAPGSHTCGSAPSSSRCATSWSSSSSRARWRARWIPPDHRIPTRSPG